jgi:hypothetical protein
MANPNPSPATRFGAGQANGSRGRQKAARDKISAAFLEALSDTFHELNDKRGSKGLDALKKMRDEDPATYARIFAALMPKQLEIADENPLALFNEEEFEKLCRLHYPDMEKHLTPDEIAADIKAAWLKCRCRPQHERQPRHQTRHAVGDTG